MRLSLLQFAALPQLRDLYTKTYFGDYDKGNFDFIGDYANYDREPGRLGGELGVHFDMYTRINVTANYPGSSKEIESKRLMVDEVEHTKLTELLKSDIALYETNRGK